MPKSYITKESRQQARFSAWLIGSMKISGITQQALADRLGCTQQGLSAKIKHQRFSYNDLLIIFDVLKPDAKELETLLVLK